MLSKLSIWFHSWAKGWIVIILFVALVTFMVITIPNGLKKIQAVSNAGTNSLDTHFFYTPEKAYSLLSSYGDAGRILYRNGLLTIDIIIPLLYTLFLSQFISWLFQRSFNSQSKLQKLNVLPVGIGIFDILENIGIVTMISIYPVQSDIIAWASSIFTMTKLSLAIIAVLLVLIGIVKASSNRFKKQFA